MARRKSSVETNPAKAWHHIQVRPKRFKIVATIQLGKKAEETNRSDHGIQVRLGREKGGKRSEWVILLFDPRLWTLARAKAWTKKHKQKVMEAVEAPEQPEHDLSPRAKAIKHGRVESEGHKEEVAFLKKHGVGCEVPSGMSKAICKAVMDACDDPIVVHAMTHGRFTDGERELLVVLPHADVVGAVNTALRVALWYENGKERIPAGKGSALAEGIRSMIDCMNGLAKKLGKNPGKKKPSAKKPAAKKHWHFSVSPAMEIGGKPLIFPEDMLRYDHAEFVGEKERKKADAKKPGVLLVSDDEPTAGRWESFGWNVDFAEQR